MRMEVSSEPIGSNEMMSCTLDLRLIDEDLYLIVNHLNVVSLCVNERMMTRMRIERRVT